MITTLHIQHRGLRIARKLRNAFVLLTVMTGAAAVQAQSVTEIITDYNGFFKTSSTANNPVRPDNHHNLLAFGYNGTRYSTGVNDALLTSRGETFTAASFRALPMNNITGVPTSNTKIGLGALADGVVNGAGTAPSRNLSQYLSDGVNGLDMGTVVANLPTGRMFLSVSNLQAAHIGDGVPDILVTQVADPSSRFDRYAFTDINGNMVGNYLDVNLMNIEPVGQWVADFYEATGSTVLGSGFTQTPRNMRLWAADFSAFGINASNIGDIAYFRIDLSGDSDIAFVAYNTTTVTVDHILALPDALVRKMPPTTSNKEEITALKIYPNPATTQANFIHPKSKGSAKIYVYSINGVLLSQKDVANGATQSSLNLSGLPSGTYHVFYSDGINKYGEKLVIK